MFSYTPFPRPRAPSDVSHQHTGALDEIGQIKGGLFNATLALQVLALVAPMPGDRDGIARCLCRNLVESRCETHGGGEGVAWGPESRSLCVPRPTSALLCLTFK